MAEAEMAVAEMAAEVQMAAAVMAEAAMAAAAIAAAAIAAASASKPEALRSARVWVVGMSLGLGERALERTVGVRRARGACAPSSLNVGCFGQRTIRWSHPKA